ncbi:class II aldolase [Fonsecaea pedrosoi]|nr:class II aldolase [Fonsecaea pedrosoi]
MASTVTTDSTLTDALRDLIWANHILDHHGVVDAYGHISIRHPHEPSQYIMCGYMAPALVASPSDLIYYHVADSSTVDPNAKKGYSERFIHGEIYKRYAGVNCVIHSHAEEVLPYVVSMGVKLKAIYHMAGFLGSKGVRVFDIDPLYRNGEQRDMLVNNSRFGAALADKFVSDPAQQAPEETVVLMRRHGFTCVADNIVTAVYRAIYTRINAEAQTKAMAIANNVPGREALHDEGMGVGFQALTDEQGQGCAAMNEAFQDKPWKLWVRTVESQPLYRNELSKTSTLS